MGAGKRAGTETKDLHTPNISLDLRMLWIPILSCSCPCFHYYTPEMDFGFRTLDFFLLAKISAQNNLIRCTWKTMPPKRFRLQKKCMYIFRILFKLEPELSYICLFKSVDANSLFTEHINNFVSLSLSRPQEERGGVIYDKYQLKIS